MFLEELFHDTIELGKKRFNGYLLILIFGVGVDDFFPMHLLLLLVALLRSHLFFFGLRIGGFIPCALPRVLLLLLLGTSQIGRASCRERLYFSVVVVCCLMIVISVYY